MEALDSSGYKVTERRIAFLTLVIGAAAAAGAAYLSSLRMGAGILAGSLLAWLSFRWLESAVDGLMRASTAAAGSAQARVPMGSVLKIMARYALIAGAVCVIFFVFQVPIVSMLLGLCALGAATIVATLYELWHPAS
jgi:ATP synthase I subunit